MNPSACPRFSACSANVCPLDSRWQERKHFEGQAVCPFVRQQAKGTYDKSLGTGEAVVNMDAILKKHSDIRTRATRVSALSTESENRAAVGVPGATPAAGMASVGSSPPTPHVSEHVGALNAACSGGIAG